MSTPLQREIARRRTFAIISHPDAGKTTITEKLLLYGGAIQVAGAVRARKTARAARSDFLEMERQRGISVSTAVMNFEYEGLVFNLLDTPGHNDFSEDTYRTLTAVDSVLMVIDSVKGVEAQTKKLLEVCRLKRTPVITLMNKLDLEGRDPLDLLDNVEKEMSMTCVPMNWPVGKGQFFKGIYEFANRRIKLYEPRGQEKKAAATYMDVDDPALSDMVDPFYLEKLRDDIALLEELVPPFDPAAFLDGKATPVFFGSALHNFGVEEVLQAVAAIAPPPQQREAAERTVAPDESAFSGFVFKIQANMDKNHRDRMAFIRICSGKFERGMHLYHVRGRKSASVRNALTFMAQSRNLVDTAYAGDIIGIPNHGTIRIGDTFTQGETLNFTGIPNFAPELFRRAQLRDPLKAKQLAKGLEQVCEEGAAQLFRPVRGADYIIGALGELQFQVIASRLQAEYGVEAVFETLGKTVCRWVTCDDATWQSLSTRYERDCFTDADGNRCLLTETLFRCNQIADKYPEITLHATVEQFR